jgi:hypothetical protein
MFSQAIIGIAVLAAVAVIGILADRGLPNSLEAVAIRLLNAASRMRKRRAAIEERQAEMLRGEKQMVRAPYTCDFVEYRAGDAIPIFDDSKPVAWSLDRDGVAVSGTEVSA